MILFPYPRIPHLISLVLAIPTWGLSLVVFYVAFKRPYDSRGVSAILAAAKRSMETRRAVGDLSHVNQGGIRRVFSKFADNAMELKYGDGAPFVRWAVLRHPMLNAGQPFTLRVNRHGEAVHIEASPGEAWWLLTDRVWLGRRGTAPGLPASLTIAANERDGSKEVTDTDSTAMGMLIIELAHQSATVEIPSLTYGRLNEFVERHELGAEWFPDFHGMRFFVIINTKHYGVGVVNVDASKEDNSAVRVSAAFSD